MECSVFGGTVAIDQTYLSASTAVVSRQVDEYLRGERRVFAVEVAYPETFTGRVMREIAATPFGETRTYGEIASALDTAAVAVGQAAGRNPVPLIVPCHRVVRADGLGGYSADGGSTLKARLLAHEGAR